MKLYYHGTLSKNIPNIQSNGLICNSKTNNDVHGYKTSGQISLTSDYEVAFYYASLFANHNPITILILKLDDSFELKKGTSFTEVIVKTDIDPKFIIGAFNDSKIVKLNQLKSNYNYINFDLLTGSNKVVALKYYQNQKQENKMKDTKLRSLLKEENFSKYEDYLGALTSAKEKNDYREFERIITESLKRKQWEWFGRYYLNMDGNSKAFTKAIFKEASPF